MSRRAVVRSAGATARAGCFVVVALGASLQVRAETGTEPATTTPTLTPTETPAQAQTPTLTPTQTAPPPPIPPPPPATRAAPVGPDWPAASAQIMLAAPPPRLRARLALQTEAAFGALTGSFHNQLAGARLDLQFSPRVSFGGYLGYANLKGRVGRASNLLSFAQVEYMAGPADPSRVRVPIRFGSGYLPGNGPVVRAAAGLAFPLTRNMDLVSEILAPMIWVTNDQMLLSMNLSLELAIRL
jgi:hypothetical protein